MSASAAETVYDFLRPSDEPGLQPADLIVGFGHFDLRIAGQCADLWIRELAPRILFTGGVGAGSADLDQPEAEAFAAALRANHPNFPPDRLIVEPSSTNTGENVRFSLELLEKAGLAIRSAILVATPFRQRRVNLTWSKVTGGVRAQNAPPGSNLATDCRIFAARGEDLIAQLPGEIDRLQTYPPRGWIDHAPVPSDVLAAAAKL